MDIATLSEHVTAAIEQQPGRLSNEEISSEMAAALQENQMNGEVRALNYKWQCHLNREYIEAHNLDSFLEKLTNHLLTVKPEHPIAELLIALEQHAKTHK